MPRTRSPDSVEAERLFLNGMALSEIAKKLGKSERTIRRWRSIQKWGEEGKEKEEKCEEKKEECGEKKGDGDTGERRHGGQPGNQNALKHGGYSAVYWDTLDEEEKEIIETMPQDEEAILVNQIKLFTVRERRLMKAINQYREAKGGVYVSGITKFEERGKRADSAGKGLGQAPRTEKKTQKEGEQLKAKHCCIQIREASTADLTTRLEKELTSVQGRKTKAIDALARLRMEKQKSSGKTKDSELVQAWMKSILKARQEREKR